MSDEEEGPTISMDRAGSDPTPPGSSPEGWTEITDHDFELAPQTMVDRGTVAATPSAQSDDAEKLAAAQLPPLEWDDDEPVTRARASSEPPPPALLDADATNALRAHSAAAPIRSGTDLQVTVPRERDSESGLLATQPRAEAPRESGLYDTRPREPKSVVGALRRLRPPSSERPTRPPTTKRSEPPTSRPALFPPPLCEVVEARQTPRPTVPRSSAPPPTAPRPSPRDKPTRTRAVYVELAPAASLFDDSGRKGPSPFDDSGRKGPSPFDDSGRKRPSPTSEAPLLTPPAPKEMGSAAPLSGFDPRSSGALPLLRELVEVGPALPPAPGPWGTPALTPIAEPRTESRSKRPPPPPRSRRPSFAAPPMPSSIPPAVLYRDPSIDDLLTEVARLRRTARTASALCAAAVSACAVMATMMLGGARALSSAGDEARVAESRQVGQETDSGLAAASVKQGIRASSTTSGVVLVVDSKRRGALPLTVDDLEAGEHELRFEGPENRQVLTRKVTLARGELLDLGDVVLLPRRVAVTIRVTSPATIVSLAKHGEPAKVLTGSFPQTLQLEPGRYAIFAARQGRARSTQLELTGAEAEREITVTLE